MIVHCHDSRSTIVIVAVLFYHDSSRGDMLLNRHVFTKHISWKR